MSEKNHVFEVLFEERYDEKSGVLSRPLVTLDDVAEAIRLLVSQGKIKLSSINPANFIKDYLRPESRNKNWPAKIRSAGFTAKQRTGDGQCFEFVTLAPGEDPFPDDFRLSGDEETYTIETLSLPLTTREIVRKDEQSVAQIAVKLHIVEHFMASSLKAVGWGLLEVTHLQNNVKLRRTEIDALYKAVVKVNGKEQIGAIAVEVKITDAIISEQIEKQALAVLSDGAFEFCIPMILKRKNKGELIAIHLEMVREESKNLDGSLNLGAIAHSAKYKFSPSLPKI